MLSFHLLLTLNDIPRVLLIVDVVWLQLSKEEIAEVMAIYDDKDAANIAKQIGGVLSSLKSKGLLIASKDGRKDLFTLVKEENNN